MVVYCPLANSYLSRS